MEPREKINEVIKNLSDSSNKDIAYCLEFLTEDFEQTKNAILKLTTHLDSTELLYNKLLSEFEKRTNGKSVTK
jgi:hypothetical protein